MYQPPLVNPLIHIPSNICFISEDHRYFSIFMPLYYHYTTLHLESIQAMGLHLMKK